MINVDLDNNIRILLAGDEVENEADLQKEIRKKFKSCTFHNLKPGDKLLHELKTFQPDIILIRTLTSKITAKKILNAINKNYPSIQIIILTDRENENEAINSVERGASDYVVRDDIKRLNIAILNALRIKSLRDKLAGTENYTNKYEKCIQRYRKWKKNIPVMFYQLELHLDGKFSFNYISPASITLLGVKPEILAKDSTPFLGLMHPDDVKKAKKAIKYSAETLNQLNHECRFIIDGKVKLYKFIAQPVILNKEETLWYGILIDNTETKYYEEKLVHERNLLQEIIDSIPALIYVKDKKGNFVFNNVSYIHSAGVTDQREMIGKNEFDFWPSEIASKSYEEDKNIMCVARAIFNKEEKYEPGPGELRWYMTTKVALFDLEGKIYGMLGISYDITKRKAMESALTASELKLTNTLKIAKLAYWEYDVFEDLFTFNDQFYSLFGTTAEKQGGYKMTSKEYAVRFVFPEDAPIVGIEVQKSAQSTDPNYSRQFEHRIVYADGRMGYISIRFSITKDSEGKTVKTFGAIQDITGRKQVEEALLENEYFLRKSQFLAHIGSYKLDLKTGRWENSETINLIFGIDDDYVKDIQGWLEIIHPEDRNEIMKYFGTDLNYTYQNFEKEYRIVRVSDGKERWVLCLGDLEYDSEGTPLLLIGTIQDITERIIREKENRELEKQLKHRNIKLEKALSNLKQMQGSLVQSEKMASLGQLTAGIAHEINNPLAFVSSNVNRLNEYFNDTASLLEKWRSLGISLHYNKQFNEEVEEIEAFTNEIDLGFILEDFNSKISSISEGTQRIKKIVEGLRGFAHVSNSSLLKASINDAIEDTLTIVWNEVKYKAEVIKNFGNLPLISCDIGEIKQVLVNLIVNAAHSIKEKGIINISTASEAAWVYVKISDTGCGIPKGNLRRIFDPFFTTKEVGKGTGLGLWISSSIIEKHGGLLTVDSVEGSGSTFTISLPVEAKHLNKNIKELEYE